MRYWESRPPPPLDRYVRCYWALVAESPGAPPPRERIVPDGRVEMVFHLGDPFGRLSPTGALETQRATLFAGQLRTSLVVQPSARAHVFGIRFHAWGARAWLGAPLSETAERLPALWEAMGPGSLELEDAIRAAPDDEARARAASAWLLRRARREALPTRETVQVARWVAGSHGRLRMSEVSAHSGIGVRRLERLFREHVGVTPKTLARISRLQAALRLLSGEPPPSAAGVALEAGYADQPHFVHDFRDLVGLTPTAYAAEQHAMSDWFGDAP